MTDLQKNWALLFSLVIMWGTSFLVTALALESFEPLFITQIRLFLGALILLVFVLIKQLPFPLDLKSLGIFLLLGLMGNALPFLLISWGQQSVPSGTAGTLMAIMPIVTVVLAHFFVEDEKLNIYKILGVATAFIGVALLLKPDFSGATYVHEGAILLAASCYATNTILVRKLSHFHPLVGAAGMLAGGTLLLLPFFVIGFASPSSVTSTSLLALIWLGIVPTGVASIVYFSTINRAGPSFLSNINFMIPVVAFVSGIIILDENLNLSSILGLVVILSGVFLTRINAHQTKSNPEKNHQETA